MAPRFWAVVPAAGVGARMAADRPKQYLDIDGRPLIAHTLAALLAEPRIAGVVVAVAADDPFWPETGLAGLPRVQAVIGGAQRYQSVLRGLQHLQQQARDEDWVLVHDAARPCLSADLLRRLIDTLADDPVGGLLALPVSDTVKRADARHRVAETLNREELWAAQTPQMFRLGALHAALSAAEHDQAPVTDECAAMERLGHKPRLVEGSPANIKVTRPDDLLLARLHLRQSSSDQPFSEPSAHAH